jgi:uncharacterized protein (TIRG00374 family)
MTASRHRFKLIIGLAIGAVFFFLAVRRVHFDQALEAIARTNYWLVAASALTMLGAHLLRAMRWRYLLAPVKALSTQSLFSALLIGYAANSFVPAHLGEILRALVIGKKYGISASAALGSIVVERIVDVVSLIAVMAVVLMVHPVPDWVTTSAILMLSAALLLCAVLVGGKRFEAQTAALVRTLLKPLPDRIGSRIEALALNFLRGIVPLQSAAHYAAALVLSVAIWLCYAAVNYICLAAFGLVNAYSLAWYVGLVVLVFTTISVVIPSTPGYVGTFHYLCQLALVMFGVPASEALSFAVIAHLVGFVPVAVIGLICAHYEGVSLYRTVADGRGR